jgi:hypothetical protein
MGLPASNKKACKSVFTLKFIFACNITDQAIVVKHFFIMSEKSRLKAGSVAVTAGRIGLLAANLICPQRGFRWSDQPQGRSVVSRKGNQAQGGWGRTRFYQRNESIPNHW